MAADRGVEDARDELEQVVRLAARAVGTPLAAVSLLDAEHRWVGPGADLHPAPTEHSFGLVVGPDDEVVAIDDTTAEAQVHDHPLVTGPPGVRSYLAAPVVAPDGVRLGTVCVLDTVPRSFGEDDRRLLADLAAVIVDHVDTSGRGPS